MSSQPIKGRDVDAPIKYINFKGQRLPLVFNNRSARIAEDIYAEKYGKDIGYYAIIAEMVIPRHRALMALIYAGITACGAQVTWEDFDDNFRLTDIDGLTQMVRNGIIDSLPEEEDGAKNLDAAPARS